MERKPHFPHRYPKPLVYKLRVYKLQVFTPLVFEPMVLMPLVFKPAEVWELRRLWQ